MLVLNKLNSNSVQFNLHCCQTSVDWNQTFLSYSPMLELWLQCDAGQNQGIKCVLVTMSKRIPGSQISFSALKPVQHLTLLSLHRCLSRPIAFLHHVQWHRHGTWQRLVTIFYLHLLLSMNLVYMPCSFLFIYLLLLTSSSNISLIVLFIVGY